METEIQNKLSAQNAYAEKMDYPHFAPNNGICWSCNKQIYELISFEKAGSSLITGCPHCFKSYCE